MKHTLLSPDAAPSGAVEADPFDVPAGGDVSMPLLKEKTYRMSLKAIDKIGVKSEEAPEGAEQFKVTWATTKEELDIRDEVVGAGWPIYQYVGITPYGKQTKANIKRNVDTLVQACVGKVEAAKHTIRQVIDDPSFLLNQVAEVKVTIRKASGDFDASNSARCVAPD